MSDVPEHLTPQETRLYLDAIDAPRDKAIALLFLTTGVFLHEIVELTTEHIDWDTRHITIPGKRSRTLQLNDQTYDALATWSQDRLVTPHTDAFFLTTKGQANGLTTRGIDTILRKYGKQAELKKTVNALLLRTTFAIRLFTEHPGLSLRKAGELLGIRDMDSLRRYASAAKTSPEEIPSTESDDIIADNRPFLTRTLSKLFPTKPKTVKAAPHTPKANPEDILLGRDSIITATRASLNKGQSILLTGDVGRGKTHLLNHFAKHYGERALHTASPSPLKTLSLELANRLTPSSENTPTKRDSLQEVIAYVIANKSLSPPLLILDNLHKLRVSELELVLKLMDHFTVLGATDEQKPTLKTLWWKFKITELPPLPVEASKQLIAQLTQHMSISDYEQMENRMLTLANGNPLSLVEMARQLSYKPVVTRQEVRKIYHEAGISYRDWSWVIAVIWGLVILFRFIALGTHSFEGYILAGVGTSIFVVIRTLTARMR